MTALFNIILASTLEILNYHSLFGNTAEYSEILLPTRFLFSRTTDWLVTRSSTRRSLFDATTRLCLILFLYREWSSACANILCVSVQATYVSAAWIFRLTRLYSIRIAVASPDLSNTSAIPSSLVLYFQYSPAFVYIPILRCYSNNCYVIFLNLLLYLLLASTHSYFLL